MKYRDGESNPDLRVEGPASFPLNDRGTKRKEGVERPRASPARTVLRTRLLIQPDRFLVSDRAEGVGLAPTPVRGPVPA